jgi:mannose-6-phosphate isomerase
VIPLIGAPQHYAWGSEVVIPRAVGVPADGRPWAELWWGTHPGGRTLARTPDQHDVPLADLAGRLPFLVKLLAAERPLSLQTHPTAEQAALGYAREERLGVPISAPHRVYRDPYGKPELILAVTRFEALCGFRPVEEAAADLEGCGGDVIADNLRLLGPSATVAWLLTKRPPIELDHPLYCSLVAEYPNDPGALVAMLLHRVTLEPGEAMFLDAGVLHTYLHGVGLEVMGPSDNVVRGGLTPKHVDVSELVLVLDTTPFTPPVLRPRADGWYPAETDAFAVQGLAGPERWVTEGPEIIVRLGGAGDTQAWYAAPGTEVSWDGGLGCRVRN